MLVIPLVVASLSAIAVLAFGDPASKPARIHILLVGDSTVTESAGWGLGFAACFSDDVQVINFAKGGRSSKSYRDEGWWDKAMAQPADYVLIQFGHNDQPGKGPERETDPESSYRQNMKRYVEEARQHGMKPVIVTSLVRRKFGPDGRIHSDLIPYVQAARAVAADTGTPLIDLHARSIELCERLGQAACREQIEPRKQDGTYDTTHLTTSGSKLIGPLVADELVKLAPELSPHISAR